jgi:hypothetical protein
LGVILIQHTENTLKKLYCDKYDPEMVSYLSLFLYNNIRILFAKDKNHKIVAVRTWNLLASSEVPISNVWKDELYKLDVPTKVFVHNNLFSLVPGVLFNPDFIGTYLSFAGDLSTDIHPFYSNLESNNFHLVGGIGSQLHQLLSDGKSVIKFHHGSSSFLSYCLKERSKFLPQEILMYLFDKSFYLAAFNKQELSLFNKFDIQNRDELLMYLFGITKQLGFERKYCRYTLLGSNNNNLDIKENWAVEYFKYFNFSNPEINQNYHEGTESFSKTFHFESHWEFM